LLLVFVQPSLEEAVDSRGRRRLADRIEDGFEPIVKFGRVNSDQADAVLTTLRGDFRKPSS